jgi:cytochrome c553
MLRNLVLATLLFGATAARADSIEEKAALCSACHGENGLPAEPAVPIISGQHSGYLYLQLRDFQKGVRKDDRMTPIVADMTKEEASALAEYFAGKPWPKTNAPAASKADKDAAMVAINSVVCTSCHLDQFQGDSSVPRLTGQQPEYLAKTMSEFRSGTRANNPGMSDLMKTCTSDQLASMAKYLAGF